MKKSNVLPQTQTQIQHSKRLGVIIERILEYHGKTREADAEYCKAAIEEGLVACIIKSEMTYTTLLMPPYAPLTSQHTMTSSAKTRI
jgi:hypothetical protein